MPEATLIYPNAAAQIPKYKILALFLILTSYWASGKLIIQLLLFQPFCQQNKFNDIYLSPGNGLKSQGKILEQYIHTGR